MSNLVNKTILKEDGITLCKPSIYELNIISDSGEGKEIQVSHMGNKIVTFELSTEQCLSLSEILSR
ncbi:hypothetical protein [Xenorhabdus bovienii]|uniref:hypothetical protein n=1 Tax=Xenorhabdus bovienii TaxID=40576 RepID=UPI0023B25526|nr:hypothetical protein [Xenorhabdus bovienii]MDE9545309.1 hypothetical protein [Xenorhabdus bovienii]